MIMGTSQTADELHLRNPVAKHNRDIDHFVEEHTHEGRVKLIQELHLRNNDDNECRRCKVATFS